MVLSCNNFRHAERENKKKALNKKTVSFESPEDTNPEYTVKVPEPKPKDVLPDIKKSHQSEDADVKNSDPLYSLGQRDSTFLKKKG